MSDAVIVALISSGTALISAILTGVITSSKTIYRIDLLEDEVI